MKRGLRESLPLVATRLERAHRLLRVGLTLTVAAMSLATTTAFAGINCNQVKKYLGTGRSAQDIAETMVISIDEVKKCQEGGDAAAAGQPAAPAATGAAASAAPTAPK